MMYDCLFAFFYIKVPRFFTGAYKYLQIEFAK